MFDRLTVDQWIAVLDNFDLSNINELETLVPLIPAALFRRVGDEGGPLIREKLLAPAFAQAEREGMMEWTGLVPESREDLALAHLQGSSAPRNLTNPEKLRARSHSEPWSRVRKWLS